MGHIFPHQSIDTVSRTLGESIDVFTQCGLQLTIQDFKDAVVKVQAEEPDITHWTFGEWVAQSVLFPGFGTDAFPSLKRGDDGRFKDSELAKIIKDAYVAPQVVYGTRLTTWQD
jgi:hypothetical protein